MQPSLFLVFLLVADTLEQDVGFVWLGDSHHLNVLVFLLPAEAYYLREGEFTNLAFELGKVIALNYSFDLLLDLAVDPGPEAADMDQSATTLAVARRNQRVVFSLLAAETHFAATFSLLDGLVVVFEVLRNFKDSVGLVEVVGIPDGVGVGLIFGLDDHVLHPA